MVIAAALAYANFSLGLFATLCAVVLARSPRWRHLRGFAYLAVTSAAYGLLDSFILRTTEPHRLTTLMQLSALVGSFHAAGWPFWSQWIVRRKATRLDAVAAAASIAVGVCAWIPGLLLSRPAHPVEVPWAGVTTRVLSMPLMGRILFPVVLFPIAVAFARFVLAARQGNRGARRYAIGLGVLSLAILNEILVASGVYPGVYVVDAAFIVVIAGCAYDIIEHIASDARKLEELSANLGRMVGERTNELSRVQHALVETERLAAMGQLAATIGHEVNNPLSYVIGNLQYAREEVFYNGSPDLNDALREALDGAERIRSIVSDLRGYSLPSANGVDDVCNVGTVMDDAVRLTRGAIRHRAIVDVEKIDVPNVPLGRQRFAQVLVNLLVNASHAISDERASQGTGRIVVRSRRGTNKTVVVEVEDNGSGMSETTRARMFEAFFTTKQVGGGTGLGLFVARSILDACGGSVEVDSELGRGTLVRIVLPMAVEHRRPTPFPGLLHLPLRSSIAPVPDEPAPASPRTTVLVVDDDARVRSTMGRMLSHCRVSLADSASACISMLDAGGAYDVILCDLMMPGRSGVELYEEILERRPELEDHFIFVTGGATTRRTASFVASNQNRTLYKPLDAKALSAKVEEVASALRIRDEGAARH
ncbi:Sensory box histidine kinase/response regulator [Labilithrix luteola]|uniref:histidine kinase n=1 Tax=Labilithrix luteola TaxID=1391654 RepID=A0A0K1Q7E4_9BACT|nr:ATP-binding protein [Labilithrix luteola]AKV01315.1 Sensory box histidine kinase/response regulator [Labilithrix luteola]